MNIVFWFFVLVVMTLFWVCLSFAFKGIGSFFKGTWEDVLDDIKDDPLVVETDNRR